MNHLRVVIEQSLYRQHITPQETLMVGLSGGRDSVCLAFCLQQLQKTFGYSLLAVHVNHHLREEADREEAFVKAFCSSLELPLVVKHVDGRTIGEAKGISLEDAARRARYSAFYEAAAPTASKGRVLLALAHHEKDQAETFLIHLLRGSGLKGLTGMKEMSPFPYDSVQADPKEREILVFRPMLRAGEALLEAFVEENRLSYVTDSSNEDLAYTRNRIRYKLIPELEADYNPHITATLSRTAFLLQEDEVLLEDLSKSAMKTDDNGNLLLTSLKGPDALNKRILRQWLEKRGCLKDMDQVHMDALLALSKGPTGRGIHLPNALTVQKSYDILTITTQPPKEFRDNSLRETFVLEYHQDGSLLQRTYRLNETSWQVETQLTDIQWVLQQFPKGIPDFSMEKYLDEACLKDAIWRTRREGDYIPLKEGRQKLKDLLINEKVPRLLRDRIPVLAVGSHVLWAVGLRISEEAKVSKTTRHVVVVRVNSTEETDRRKQC